MTSSASIEHVAAAAYLIPTDAPESDGTLTWDATTLVVARVDAGGKQGIGYTYADSATAALIRDKLAPLLVKHDAMATNARWYDMVHAIRNLGRPGICSMAIAGASPVMLSTSGFAIRARNCRAYAESDST